MSTERTTLERVDSTYAGNQQLLIDVADIVGHKWHSVILHRLLSDGAHGFGELKSSIDGISNKMLSESLSALEDHDLVDRDVVDDKPVRVEYSPTDRGRALEDVIAAMVSWGATHLDGHGPVAGTSDLPSRPEGAAVDAAPEGNR